MSNCLILLTILVSFVTQQAAGLDRKKAWSPALRGRRVIHGSSVSKGRSNRPMEDFVAAEMKRVNDHDVGMFAVYDGHLGHEVARYLQSNLLGNILDQVPCPFLF
jgi:menaquinone-dependent protoporphyrinogen IX oxidase